MSSQADFNASMRYYLSNGIHSIQFTCIIFVNKYQEQLCNIQYKMLTIVICILVDYNETLY